MTRVRGWDDGAELGDTDWWDAILGNVTAASGGMHGDYSYYINGAGSAATKNFDQARATFVMRCYVKPANNTTLANLMNIRYSTNVQFSIFYDPTSGQVLVKRGFAGTILITASATIQQNVWTLFELHATVNNVTGSIVLYLANNLVGTYSGNTQDSLAGTADNIAFLNTFYLDDFALDTADAIGPGGYIVCDVVEAGSAAEWTPTPAVPNWENVSETPPDQDTSYNAATAANQTDLYGLQPYTIPLGFQIAGVMPIIKAKDQAASGAQVNVLLKSGSTYASAARSLTGAYRYHIGDYYSTNPATGLQWSGLDIGTVEIGVKSA